MGLSGTLAAGFMFNEGLNVPLALFLAILSGVIFGCFNGFIVAKANIPPFIVTLAALSIARGISLLYTGGKPIYNLPRSFIAIGRGTVGGIPISFIITLAVFFAAQFILSRTKFGRYVYAIGGNEDAARLSGVTVDKIKILVYTISGFTAAIGGIILSARLASGQPTLGLGMELDAIAAVVLGGTSLFGGKGHVWGTLFGALFLTVLGNGLNLMGVSSFWQQVMKGAILLIAVMAYERGKRTR